MSQEDLEYQWSSMNAENSVGNPIIMAYDHSKEIDSKFEWKPTNLNYGLVPLNPFVYHGLETFYNTEQVPWSHGRDVVPRWLANHGVSLDLWQEWVDRATLLWMERNRICQRLIKLGSNYTLQFLIAMALLIISPYLPDTMIFVVWQFFLFLYMIFLVIYNMWWRRFKDGKIFRIEVKWSELINDINSKLEVTSTLGARHCYTLDIVGRDCCPRGINRYTVGVIFWNKDEGKNHPMSRKENNKVNPNKEDTHMNQSGVNKFDSFRKNLEMNTLNWKLSLRPTDPNFGQEKSCISWLLGSSPTPINEITVPWSYGREEVPTWLSFQGVTLTLWQQWLDQASSLWIERIQQNETLWNRKRYMSLYYLVILPLFVPWTLILPDELYSYLLGFMSIITVILLFCFIAQVKWQEKQQFTFLDNERKWSDLVQSINDETVKDLGLRADHCYDIAYTKVLFPRQTVGIEFSMEPGMSHDNH